MFVQFPDLMASVAAALNQSGLPATMLHGSVHVKTAALESMQKETLGEDEPRILMLSLADESAAGANLAMCNHVFIVHALLTETAQEYHAFETQAIGRALRYGQTKTVHILRFIVDGTADREILDQRKSQITA